jgi:hypothetical protein
MNARPNPRNTRTGKRAWIALALVSAGGGALVVILIMTFLGPQLGQRLDDVVQAIRLRQRMVTDSPRVIMRWYHQFDGDAAAQAAAATQYYDRYVAWELSLDEVEPVGAYARTVSQDPGATPDDPPHAIWAFFAEADDVAQLRKQETVTVRGKIVFINASNIFLGDCRLINS